MSTQTETPPIEPHWAHSERLMQHAFDELAKGDRIQASEKAWGAMAHTLKAIADERGLIYGRHNQAWGVVSAVLADVTNDTHRRFILGGFNTAEILHRNFYDDVHQQERLELELGEVQSALALLNEAHGLWRERNAPAR